jgi:hypothetical protein
MYHGIRLDLGVIRPNQIYNSSTRFNASIANLPDKSSYVSQSRFLREAIDNVDISKSNYSVHVPVILYLTPQFKRKPVEQAIAAVFISTFTMLSAIWKAFNFVASSVVKERSKSGRDHILKLCICCSDVDISFRAFSRCNNQFP